MLQELFQLQTKIDPVTLPLIISWWGCLMDKAILNKELIATKAENITVYNYDGETREYISSTEYLAVVSVSRHSCLDTLAHIKLVMQFAVLEFLTHGICARPSR